MNVTVNGRDREVPAQSTLDQVLAELGLAPSSVLVELNQTALHRDEMSDRRLQPGDRIELLRIAAGG